MHYNYLIIGGGIAGVTAAETIREGDRKGTIAVIEREPHILYSRVLLPNYIKKLIRRDQLFLRKIDDFERNDIDLLLEKEAASLDVQKKEVKGADGEIYSFDKLLIASGGAPRPTGIPGEGLNGVFRLQTIDDADRILGFLSDAKKAVVVGGGFIALEFLEIARAYELQTMLICRDGHFFGKVLDDDGGKLMAENFERSGIELLFGDAPETFGGKEKVTGLRTKSGKVLGADFVGIGAGLRRNDDFLLGTGIARAPGSGAMTNEFMETPAPGIFAAGDIAEYFDVVSGRRHFHGNWTNAFLQGKIAGRNMLGSDTAPFRNVSSYSIKNLGLHITLLGEAGENEETQTVSRVDAPSKRYERFFLSGGKLVGAALINMFHDKSALSELIEKQIPVANYRDNLADMAFDVRTLLDGNAG